MTPDPITLSRSAWNAIRSEHQPLYDDLEEVYRGWLHDRAEKVIADRRTLETEGTFFRFEQEVLEQVVPERFHGPVVAQDAVAEEVVDDAPKPKKATAAKAVKVVKKKRSKSG